MSYWEHLKTEKCCYTCNHNRNALDKSYPCNCEFANKCGNIYQDEMACDDYENIDE